MIESFLNSVAVIDTEATSNKPEYAEIIELGVSRYKCGSWETSDTLFKPQALIPPTCSAICNITNHMVADSLSFTESISFVFDLLDPINTRYYVAHNAQYDIAVLNANFKRADVDFNIERDLGKDSWICTFRLAQRILGRDDKSVQFGQSFLRYYFQLNLDPLLFPHRAGNDSNVCAHILVKLIELGISKGMIDPTLDIGKQLANLSWAKIPVKKWPYGKHEGKLISELDDGFLRWAILHVNDLDEKSFSYDADLAAAVELEIAKRPAFKL